MKFEKNSLEAWVESADPPDAVGVGVHDHHVAELGWISEGVMRVYTRAGVWIAPSTHAVWVPGSEPHDGWKHGKGRCYWAKVAPEAVPGLPAHACIIRMTAALRDQLLAQAELRPLPEQRRQELVAVLRETIRDVGVAAVKLPLVLPPSILPLHELLTHAPADDRTLDDWARVLKMNARTLERTFQREVDMSFRQFRTRVRLVWALEQLALGRPVSDVGAELGYRSLSMFVERFREHLGSTPGRYFDVA